VPTIEFDGKVYTCPFHDLLPPLSQDDHRKLKADILARGKVLVPVMVILKACHTPTHSLTDTTLSPFPTPLAATN
jgi:hypothetical protein